MGNWIPYIGREEKEDTPFIKDVKLALYVIIIIFIGIFNRIRKEYSRIIIKDYIFVISLKNIEKALAPKKIYIEINFRKRLPLKIPDNFIYLFIKD